MAIAHHFTRSQTGSPCRIPFTTLSATAMDITLPEHRKVHVTYGRHPADNDSGYGLHQLADLRPFTQQERPYPSISFAPRVFTNAFHLLHSLTSYSPPQIQPGTGLASSRRHTSRANGRLARLRNLRRRASARPQRGISRIGTCVFLWAARVTTLG